MARKACDNCGGYAEKMSEHGAWCAGCWEILDRIRQATINGADALNRRKSEHARLRILDGGRA
jgi:hypothetical protein